MLLSIIVPTYNVEKYIKKTINSIAKQSYTDIEILIIDDNSTDATVDICLELQKKDKRIRIIRKNENKGVANSRNLGIKNSRGEYIMFVDADDYVDSNFCLNMLKVITTFNADIAFCDFYILEDHILKNMNLLKNKELMSVVTLEEASESLLDASFAWNKIYKRELFNGISYPEGRTFEDTCTTFKLFKKAKKIAYLSEPLYFYIQRKNSIVHTPNINNTNNFFIAMLELSNYFETYGFDSLKQKATEPLLIASYNCCMFRKNKKLYKERALKVIRTIQLPNNLSNKLRLKIRLIRLSPRFLSLFRILRRIKYNTKNMN